MLQDWKVFRLQALPYILQSENVTGWDSEGVKTSILLSILCVWNMYTTCYLFAKVISVNHMCSKHIKG